MQCDKIIIGGVYTGYILLYSVEAEDKVFWFWSVIPHLFAGQPLLIRQECIRDIIIPGQSLRQ